MNYKKEMFHLIWYDTMQSQIVFENNNMISKKQINFCRQGTIYD